MNGVWCMSALAWVQFAWMPSQRNAFIHQSTFLAQITIVKRCTKPSALWWKDAKNQVHYGEKMQKTKCTIWWKDAQNQVHYIVKRCTKPSALCWKDAQNQVHYMVKRCTKPSALWWKDAQNISSLNNLEICMTWVVEFANELYLYMYCTILSITLYCTTVQHSWTFLKGLQSTLTIQENIALGLLLHL